MDTRQHVRRLPVDPEIADFIGYVQAQRPDVVSHCSRVADLCGHYADVVESTAETRQTLVAAAYLHDIGKSFIPREILDKPGALTQDERAVINHHPLIGAAILWPVLWPHARLRRIAVIVGQHHERFDGQGYPAGLQGSEIDPLAQPLAVVDAFCAMVEDRLYAGPVPVEVALREIAANRATQFDPDVVDAFFELDLREWSSLRTA